MLFWPMTVLSINMTHPTALIRKMGQSTGVVCFAKDFYQT